MVGFRDRKGLKEAETEQNVDWSFKSYFPYEAGTGKQSN
jgi:hypothetical protein